MSDLKQKLESLPHKSGVYLMYDKYGNIIYIGKARILKNRVRQYFQHGQKPPKVLAMMEKVCDFDYIITISELDALVLEANLVKKHSPHYNILLKDDKAAPFIRIDSKKDFPYLEITRKVKNDGAKYFGPFILGIPVKQVAEIIKAAYKMRSCASFKKGQRACLNYHLQLCAAPCEGNISKQEYAKIVDKVCAFLRGKDNDAEQLLLEKMNNAVACEEFERAIRYRDNLQALQRMKQKIATTLETDEDADFFAYAYMDDCAVVSALFVRDGKLMGHKNFAINDVNEQAAQALESFLPQFYIEQPYVPPTVCLSDMQVEQDSSTLQDFLCAKAGKKVEVCVPKRGKKAYLLQTARDNAHDFLQRESAKIKRGYDMTVGAVYELQELLGLQAPPMRMECFDISNLSGVDNVASMTVMQGGVLDKKSYRRFKIKTVEGANDYACHKETLLRRFKRLNDFTFGDSPSLIVMDGGKGQLSAALEAMQEANVDFPVIALAEKQEEIFVKGKAAPIFVPRNSNALKMLIRLRDEAHRFAVTYQQKTRINKYTSELLSIEGVGQTLAKNIFAHFGDIEKIKNATLEELTQVKRLSRTTAQKIVDYFQNN